VPERTGTLELTTGSPAQTRRLGRRLGELLRPGDVVLLEGEFGAGKTVLSQGIAAGLGVAEYVTSPSFTLINVAC
jgi:tRNA threonylcarbamoyladenosine biosynthesis protein TsaE